MTIRKNPYYSLFLKKNLSALDEINVRRAELDEYYYGARYYNPRESVWLSVDPLSGYNPVLEREHYIDGQHNGGVYNSFNHNTYGYCYQSPVKLVDPNGKQAYFQGMFNQSAMQAAAWNQQHPQKPMTSGVIKDALSGVKKDLSNLTENAVSKSLRFTGEVTQDIGDGISFSGYFLTLTVVGAKEGVFLSNTGNTISSAGSYMQIGADVLEGNGKKVVKDVIKDLVIKSGQKFINNKIDKISGASKLTKEILKQNVDIKIKTVDKLHDYMQKKDTDVNQNNNVKTERISE